MNHCLWPGMKVTKLQAGHLMMFIFNQSYYCTGGRNGLKNTSQPHSIIVHLGGSTVSHGTPHTAGTQLADNKSQLTM